MNTEPIHLPLDVVKRPVYVVYTKHFHEMPFLQGMKDVYQIDSESYARNFHDQRISSSHPGHVQDMLYACFMLRFKIASLVGTGKYSL